MKARSDFSLAFPRGQRRLASVHRLVGRLLASYVTCPFNYYCSCYLPFFHWVDCLFSSLIYMSSLYSLKKNPYWVYGLQIFSPIL